MSRSDKVCLRIAQIMVFFTVWYCSGYFGYQWRYSNSPYGKAEISLREMEEKLSAAEKMLERRR